MKHLPALFVLLAVGAFAAEPASPPPAAPPAKSAEKSKGTPAPPPPAAVKPTASPASDAKSAPGAKPEGVQGLEREFGERSKDLIEKRKVLLERLGLAKTDEEKQRILAELRQQNQERIDQQRERARQIREELQTRRSDSRAASPGS